MFGDAYMDYGTWHIFSMSEANSLLMLYGYRINAMREVFKENMEEEGIDAVSGAAISDSGSTLFAIEEYDIRADKELEQKYRDWWFETYPKRKKMGRWGEPSVLEEYGWFNVLMGGAVEFIMMPPLVPGSPAPGTITKQTLNFEVYHSRRRRVQAYKKAGLL